jgi:hypothetical protein
LPDQAADHHLPLRHRWRGDGGLAQGRRCRPDRVHLQDAVRADTREVCDTLLALRNNQYGDLEGDQVRIPFNEKDQPEE